MATCKTVIGSSVGINLCGRYEFRKQPELALRKLSGKTFCRLRSTPAELAAKALKDPGFRARLVSDPKTTYAAELGREIRAETKIVVLEERGDTFYLVLPCLPETLKTRDDITNAVARRELTYRSPCWGLGDGPEAGISCKA